MERNILEKYYKCSRDQSSREMALLMINRVFNEAGEQIWFVFNKFGTLLAVSAVPDNCSLTDGYEVLISLFVKLPGFCLHSCWTDPIDIGHGDNGSGGTICSARTILYLIFGNGCALWRERWCRHSVGRYWVKTIDSQLVTSENLHCRMINLAWWHHGLVSREWRKIHICRNLVPTADRWWIFLGELVRGSDFLLASTLSFLLSERDRWPDFRNQFCKS